MDKPCCYIDYMRASMASVEINMWQSIAQAKSYTNNKKSRRSPHSEYQLLKIRSWMAHSRQD
jgi:hypothetical protein